jgi:hypothetical protein
MSQRVSTFASSPAPADCLRLAAEAEEAAADELFPNVRAKHLLNAERWRKLAVLRRSSAT